jgi:UDP-N-acetylglucosamine 2-epimerase (non-hydrolysing)
MAAEFGNEFDGNGIKVTEPLGFLEFLQLEANARLALTDSGGVQEETCIQGVPCVTLRENTERPETVDVNSCILVGANSVLILKGTKQMMENSHQWTNPFGDGIAGRQIIDRL